MVWAACCKAEQPSCSSDGCCSGDPESSAVGVRCKPLKKRRGLSRFYSSKSQSFSSLELVQCTPYGDSALALAKRPSSFDLQRQAAAAGGALASSSALPAGSDTVLGGCPPLGGGLLSPTAEEVDSCACRQCDASSEDDELLGGGMMTVSQFFARSRLSSRSCCASPPPHPYGDGGCGDCAQLVPSGGFGCGSAQSLPHAGASSLLPRPLRLRARQVTDMDDSDGEDGGGGSPGMASLRAAKLWGSTEDLVAALRLSERQQPQNQQNQQNHRPPRSQHHHQAQASFASTSTASSASLLGGPFGLALPAAPRPWGGLSSSLPSSACTPLSVVGRSGLSSLQLQLQQ